ncbi:tRNA (adenosine(37)-N6)-threonylcarbamoyltransferase complex ATPase subunit type 1 TsaE [Geothrix sp.]|uniref:tRNA (adenosine(37)-N6)-threonylcarbamoyltransferase complex ATPase subunit type 1 TsaE n=1 Tax=Geothrix sp. TaxID=1962974 RepID=UPI0025C5E2EA|nr:tRNA (adenosine(37)-N6)-threonylcarbamoyltransferase complex ATPase subunit type 1 TsaE [Geothrix sp.]WIL22272.1 MAG: tRNA (adenosine(37)-N6)-threonylcarbamoyltransferase complex ATPase subunit type 1 TsaE [Geothrix sp.]
MPELFLADEEATEALGEALARLTPPGGTWLLKGELGAGKTTWTRGFLRGLGGDPEEVASPTYAVLHRYGCAGGRLFHLDLFRTGPEGAWSLGLEESLGAEDRLVVEWAGGGGPWPTDWVARLELRAREAGRQADWTLPDEPAAR